LYDQLDFILNTNTFVYIAEMSFYGIILNLQLFSYFVVFQQSSQGLWWNFFGGFSAFCSALK